MSPTLKNNQPLDGHPTSLSQGPARGERGRILLNRAVVATLSAALLTSSVAMPALALQDQPADTDSSTPVQPISADDPQPKDAFAADPFAEEVADPAASKPSDASAADVQYDAASETVEIHVSDADLLDVLRMLSVQSQKNIVASRDVRGTVTCNLFDVTMEEALGAILRSNGFVAREEGSFIYIYTQEEFDAMEEQNRQMETRVFRLYHISAKEASEIITPSLSEGVKPTFSMESETGIGSNRDEAGGYSYSNGDVLVIRDYPERLDQVEQLLTEIDERPQQVLIEATILSTKLNENNAFGVDFNVVGGVDFSEFSSNNGQITGGNLSETGDPGSEVYGAGTGNNFTSPIAGGLKLGFVSNEISAFVSALEGITDTSVLANPKVLALNKQRGEVLVGREDGYITTTLTETAATQTVEMLKTGTRLNFRPYISRDGFIRLEIHPEDSTGGLNASNLPFKTTTEVTSNVMVKDGHTIVIGGLFRESASTNRSQVPVLGNIPILGALFRRQADNTQREEIIILLTPHIVKDLGAYAQMSEEELKRAEKLRVGVRKGMMPTGRERMAQVYYERAVREMSKDNPRRKRANYYLNAATNLNPTFIEAIELKERLTGRVVVEADQSTIRSFLRRAMIQDVRKPDNDPVIPEPVDLMETSEEAPTTQPADSGEEMNLLTKRQASVSAPTREAGRVTPPATRPSTRPTTRPSNEWVDADQ